MVGTAGRGVVLGSGSGGGRPLSVGWGASAWGWRGEGASSVEADVGVTLSGGSPLAGGSVGGASGTRGGPENEEMRKSSGLIDGGQTD